MANGKGQTHVGVGQGMMMEEALKVLSDQNNELLHEVEILRQAQSWWTLVSCLLLQRAGHVDPDTQFIITEKMINEISGSELGYTNNSNPHHMKHYLYVILPDKVAEMQKMNQPHATGQEMVDAGKKQSTNTGGRSRLVDFQGKPLTD